MSWLFSLVSYKWSTVWAIGKMGSSMSCRSQGLLGARFLFATEAWGLLPDAAYVAHIISPQDHNPGSLIKKRGDEGVPGCGGGSPGSGLVPHVVITGLPLGPQIATCNLSLQ